MKKDELIRYIIKEEKNRYKAALATLLVAGGILFGIGKFGEKAFSNSSKKGFNFTTGEDNSYVALEDSFINNNCIDKCYVVEAYNKITEETELFIAKRSFIILPKKLENGEKGEITYYYYLDLMNNNNKLFYQDNSLNSAFEFIKETPLYDYMITLDLIKSKYSYEDMERILEEIKSVYKFEINKELVK